MKFVVVTRTSVLVMTIAKAAVLRLVFSLCIVSFLTSCDMNIKPSTTTLVYGESHTDTEKVANNDSSVDSDKTTWSIKQVFKWGDK